MLLSINFASLIAKPTAKLTAKSLNTVKRKCGRLAKDSVKQTKEI